MREDLSFYLFVLPQNSLYYTSLTEQWSCWKLSHGEGRFEEKSPFFGRSWCDSRLHCDWPASANTKIPQGAQCQPILWCLAHRERYVTLLPFKSFSRVLQTNKCDNIYSTNKNTRSCCLFFPSTTRYVMVYLLWVLLSLYEIIISRNFKKAGGNLQVEGVWKTT